MKNTIYITLLLLFFACNTDDNTVTPEQTNKVLLLKVDYLTNQFEGGKELAFSESDSFTISSTYNPPGDFGDIQLYYNELNEKIFDGTIIWLGLGERAYPATLNITETFSTTTQTLDLPELTLFETVVYDPLAFYPETIDYSNIWNAINNLEAVASYRNSNPQGKINLFLYTPSVGIGDPADWDWYIYIKN